MVSPSQKHFRPDVNQAMKYVIVSGGVCSSLGKGVTSSSIGALLRARGYRVTAIKIDPYLNIDAGLMSPYEHGEVFVLDDGGEADLDLGNYERMMGLSLMRGNNITTGKIYSQVINNERRGNYLGRTVQVVPHITSEVINWINRMAHTPTDGTGLMPHVCVIELGGTVGDIESMPFLEAIRQLRFNLSQHSVCMVHCTYVPDMSGQKTKPTQHTVKALQALGIQPDLLVARCLTPVEEGTKKKISNQCNIHMNRVVGAHNVSNLFHFMQMLEDQSIMESISDVLRLDKVSLGGEVGNPPHIRPKTLPEWNVYAQKVDAARSSEELRIAFIGKYIKGGEDAYLSVAKALEHSAVEVGRRLKLEYINSTDLQLPEDDDAPVDADEAAASPQKLYDDAVARMKNCHGIFVPGGFGDRGIEGKVKAAQLAREWKKPYFGVCLGMQVAIMEFGRNVLGLEGATSEEFDKEKQREHHVVEYMPEIPKDSMGANMRLGGRWVELKDKDSILYKIYGGADRVSERHRHRYEFNMKYFDDFQKKQMIFTGKDETGTRMDAIELRDGHPFFFAVQYHPEFKSRPGAPSPPFYAFVSAAADPKNVQSFCDQQLKAGSSVHYTTLSESGEQGRVR